MATQPAYVKKLVSGYAAGMNRYFRETGADNLPEGDAGCRNAEWAREITALDIWKYLRCIVFQGGIDNGTIRRAIMDVFGSRSEAGKPPIF